MAITPTKFFKNAFAVAGDKLAIPNDVQPGGSVSYAQGYGFDYQRNLVTDPFAKPVPRDQTNQFYYDVTLGLQEYQSWGVPNFISTADNDGTPYSYSKYAFALYDDGINGPRIYQSKINANTSLPTDTTKWRWIDNSAGYLAIDDASFEGTVASGNAVYWNTVNSQFTKAIANGTSAQQMVGIADVTNKRVLMSGDIATLTGLTPGATYYLSTTVAGALTAVVPATNLVQVGIAKSATELFMNILISPPDLTAYFADGVVNGACSVAQRQATNIVNNTTTFGLVDAIAGLVAATSVTAGTFNQGTGNAYSSAGTSFKFSTVSTTGSTVLTARARIEAADAANYRDDVASFGCWVMHDFGVTVDFKIQLNKANAVNNFGAVTAIATSPTVSIPSGVATWLKFENASMGACSNGIEILVIGSTGALTTKNLDITDFQLNTGVYALEYIPRSINIDYNACLRRYQKSYDDGVAVGTATMVGSFSGTCLGVVNTTAAQAAGSFIQTVSFAVPMIKSPAVTAYNPVTGSSATPLRSSGAGNFSAAFYLASNNNTKFTIYNNVSIAPDTSNIMSYHWAADAEL